MPTIKSSRRTRKSKPYTRRRGKALNRKQKSQVKKILSANEETRAFDTYERIQVSSTGSITDLSTIVQGDAVNQREANLVNPVSIRLFFYSEIADSTNICRYIVFRWHEDDTFDAPVPGDVLNLGALASDLQWINMTNYGQRKNFTILYDSVHRLDSSFQHHFEAKKLKLKKKIAFDTGVNTGKDHIYLLRISDSTAVTHPSMTVYARLYYKDP